MRRFGRVDDFELTCLFLKTSLPHFNDVVSLVRKGMSTPLPGVAPHHIARAVYRAVALADDAIVIDLKGDLVRVPLVSQVASVDDVKSVVEECLDKFEFYVRECRGHQIIQGNEGQAQVLFNIVASAVAAAHDIDLSREIDTGRGPVDFKLSRGATARVLIEMKRASNSAFWDGLRAQVPTYLRASRISAAYFVPILQNGDTELDGRRVQELSDAVSKHYGIEIRVKTIDARRPPSASKVRGITPSGTASDS